MTDSAPDDTVLADISDGICTLTLNRPQSLNAVNPDMAAALVRLTAEAREDDAVRVLVIRGAGNHFMAGGDVKRFKILLDGEPDKAVVRKTFETMIGDVHDLVLNLRQMRKPVIASAQGAVAGFGVSLLLACDLAIAADDAFFTLAYCHLGISPDGGSTYALPRTVGLKRAFEMALLGDRFDAAAARDAGIVNRVVAAGDLDAETRALAARLAQGPAEANGHAKALLNASLHRSLKEQLDAEKESFGKCVMTADFAEGVDAFVEKRAPIFGKT